MALAPSATADSSLRDCTAHIGQSKAETKPSGLRAYLTEKLSGGSNRPAGLVERETWTDGRWPFTVDSATLLCTKGAGGYERVVVVANGEMYALNGTAKDVGLWPPFEPIWRDDPKAPGLKVNIGPVIDRGLALCGG